MKRFLLLVVFITACCVGYVWLQVRIVSFSYQLRTLLQKKDSVLCTQQYLIAKLLSITSPDHIQEKLLARQVTLSYSSPQKVVKVDVGISPKGPDSVRSSWLLGMPQAVAADE